MARAIAGTIRRTEIRVAGRRDFDNEIVRLVERNLLGPTRAEGLKSVGIDEVQRRENAIQEALRPDIEHLYIQVSRGNRPRARARKRLSGDDTLSLRIPTTADSRFGDREAEGRRL